MKTSNNIEIQRNRATEINSKKEIAIISNKPNLRKTRKSLSGR